MLDAELAQIGALLVAAGRRIDLRAVTLGDRDRGETDAAGRRMNENLLALLDPAERCQRVLRGRIAGRDRGGLREREVFRDLEHQRRRHRDLRGEGAAGDGHNALADQGGIDASADLPDDAGALEAEPLPGESDFGFRRQQAGRRHHVAEIQADGVHLDQHLAVQRRARRHLAQQQIVDHARAAHGQAEFRTALLDIPGNASLRQRIVRHTLQAQAKATAAAQRDLRFAGSTKQLNGERIGRSIGRIEVDHQRLEVGKLVADGSCNAGDDRHAERFARPWRHP